MQQFEPELRQEIVPALPTGAPAGASPVVGAYPPGEESEAGISLRGLLDILRRRRDIALRTLVLVVALGVSVTLMTKPVYRSGARLLVEGEKAMFSINNVDNPFTSILNPSAGQDAATQVEVLRSSELINRVYKAAGLAPGTVDLQVRQVQATNVIDISATSTSELAARGFIEEMPRVYLADVRGARLDATSTALQFAQKRLQEETRTLNQSEEELLRFKERARLVDPAAQREGELSEATEARATLGKAEQSVASLRAQLSALEDVRRSLPGNIESRTTTSNTAEIAALEAQIADLQSQRKDQIFLYKEGNPEIVRIDRRIADLQGRLARVARERETVTRSSNPSVFGYETKIADARAALRAGEADLTEARRRVGNLGGRLGRFNAVEREQSQIQRRIAASAGAVDSLFKSASDLSLRLKALEAQREPVRTIEAASPAVQIAPRLQQNLIMALFLGIMLACGAALLQESLDDHIHNEDEVRRLLGIPILGYFPLMPTQPSLVATVRAALPTRAAPALDLASNGAAGNGHAGPDASGAEAEDDLKFSWRVLEKFRVLRSNVLFTAVDRTLRTLLVTSSVPQEGKSYTASNLAVAVALDGRRVILVDADLHRPRVHEAFGVPVQPGLTDILIGQAKLDGCLHQTSVPGLRVLTAGGLPPNPVELLGSLTMADVLKQLEERADLVIFDSPPLLATADAQMLSAKADGVLFMIQMGHVPRSSVLRSFELLQQARANVIGVVLNKIDEAVGHSSYYGYYGDDPAMRNGSANGSASEARAHEDASA